MLMQVKFGQSALLQIRRLDTDILKAVRHQSNTDQKAR